MNKTLPGGETLTLVYAAGHGSLASSYFNGKRLGFIGPATGELYDLSTPALQAALVNGIGATGLEFDAVVCPPSSGTDAAPYLDAVIARWGMRDLSGNFSRAGLRKATGNDTTVDDMIAEFIYTPDGQESGIRSLLVVDEAIATGKSVEALLYHLRAAGMSADAKVIVAACVKMI